MNMNIIITVFLILLGIQAVVYEPVEGLCTATNYRNCPDEVQMKGLCCRRAPGQPLTFYKNICFACQVVSYV